MRRKRRGLSSDEVQVWHHVARQAKPLPGRKLPDLPEEPQPPVPAALPEPPKPVAKPSKKVEPRPIPPLAPLDRRARRDVARGLQPLDGRIDLHGLRQAEAHGDLLAFLYAMHHRGAKLVLVITGKGGGWMRVAKSAACCAASCRIGSPIPPCARLCSAMRPLRRVMAGRGRFMCACDVPAGSRRLDAPPPLGHPLATSRNRKIPCPAPMTSSPSATRSSM